MRALDGYIEKITEFEGSDALWYMAKGHVSKEAFRAECLLEFDHEIPVEAIKHAFARNVPAGESTSFPMIIHLAAGRGQGAYPITYFDLVHP